MLFADALKLVFLQQSSYYFSFQVKDIYIFPELFSVENGLLTPTFKNKRPQLRKFFKQQVQELYAKNSS